MGNLADQGGVGGEFGGVGQDGIDAPILMRAGEGVDVDNDLQTGSLHQFGNNADLVDQASCRWSGPMASKGAGSIGGRAKS